MRSNLFFHSDVIKAVGKMSVMLCGIFVIITGHAQEKAHCQGDYECIGMVIDSGDPVLVQMGKEMSRMVAGSDGGTAVYPTEGPIANTRKMLGRANAGLSVVPSDMLRYTTRSGDSGLTHARKRLRFIMTIGKKTAYLLTRRSIADIKDLAGKRVVMGPSNTAIWVVSSNLLHIHGVKPSHRIEQKPSEGILSLLTGKADAVFIVGPNPHPLLENLVSMGKSDAFSKYAKDVHLIPIVVPDDATEYVKDSASYPGFAKAVPTVAILPTLVSYDFTHRDTPYFKRRCNELANVGNTVINRLDELRSSGHKQWQTTSWNLNAGKWKRDDCFFRGNEAVTRRAGGTATATQ